MKPESISAPNRGGYVNYDALAADGEADDEEEPEELDAPDEADELVDDEFDDPESLELEPDVLDVDAFELDEPELESLEVVVERESLR
ncbi:hypothetical protein [Salinibacterium sp. SWN1162]|uniref:hypothetical protein n=1 Tax=unclassified Salinibacterium TaxID=2632331 RepID=UPI0027DCA0E6|nr:hypothetical protein [Salinibacterium sp. SWN1162]